MDIFEQASRRKLRFETALGQLNTEDLWSLPLSAREIVTRPGGSRVNLNAIAIALHERIQASAVSFVEAAPKVATDLQLRFDIVKHIIDVRIAERDAMKEAIAKIERKQKAAGGAGAQAGCGAGGNVGSRDQGTDRRDLT